METSTPDAKNTKKTRKSMTVSPIIQNEAANNMDRKVYSKRTRKPRKMYEFEDSSVHENDLKEDQGEDSVDQQQNSIVLVDEKESLGNMVEQKRKRGKKSKLSTTGESVGKEKLLGKTGLDCSKSDETESNHNLPNNEFENTVNEKSVSETNLESVRTSQDTDTAISNNRSEKTAEGENAEKASALNTPDANIDHNKKIKKKRGRTPKSDKITPVKQTEADSGVTANSSKRRGQRKSAKADKNQDISVIDTSVGNESLGDYSITSLDTPRRGRKRKVVDYAAINSGSQDDSDGEEQEIPATSRKKKAEKDDGDSESDENTTTKTKTSKSQKKSGTTKEPLKCPKCEELFQIKSALQRHAAITHQLWWTPENPQGDGIERASLREIFKYKKYLNCIKCDKRINFVAYYYHHVEWCGRENETYTCADCGHRNLKAVWRQQHRLTCSGLVRQEPEPKPPSDKEEEDENTDPSVPRKRKAARKALSIVHNLSKDVDKDDIYHDNRDDDPDAKIDNDEEEDDDEDDIDDEIDEDELASDGEGEEPSDEDDGYTHNSSRVGVMKEKSYSTSRGTYNKYLDTYPMMLKYAEKKKTEKLFQDLLPLSNQWVLLDEQERLRYLPASEHSVKFKIDSRKELTNLKFPDSVIVNGFPMMYTGLCVWKVAWCPMPVRCKDDQFLAIVGKLDKSTPFSPSKQTGPGVIQIWNCGPLLVKGEVKKLPKLWYCVGHEFGHATEIKWCPYGYYKTNSEQGEDDRYTRLGLLAASFTDGTIRVFSLPVLPNPENSEIRVYKTNPVMTLYAHHCIDDINVCCMCMDWQEADRNRKILAGYSDGKVCLFDLECKTKPLLMKSDTTDGRCILPFKSFQAHGKLVRTVCWLTCLEDLIVTGCENFETYIWNLNNTNFPIFQDSGVFMATCSASSMWHPGIFLGSDDNYAISTNRSRYLEAGCLAYATMNQQRRNEACSLFFASQPACVWGVAVSNWVGFAVACDNRGFLVGMPMHDPFLYTPDTKLYKHRQLLFRTDEKSCKTKKSKDSGNVVDNCDGGTVDNDQSETTLQKNDQTEKLLDKSSDITASLKSTQSDHKNKDPGTNLTNDEGAAVEDLDDHFLKFTEHFKKPISWVYDTENDLYQQETNTAIKTVQFNPNHLQCTWMAFGGDTGLVRLANIINSIPLVGQEHF